jgi:hypothetical protein
MTAVEQKENFCPICQGDMDDTRHVGVECFYEVHEVAPQADKVIFLKEVESDGFYWGVTRRYPAGTRDKFRTAPTGENSIRLDTEQEPIAAARAVEVPVYQVTCCKSCRADFLRMFGQWSRGALIQRQHERPDADIPVMVNGAVAWMTPSEYAARASKGTDQ